MKYTVSILLGLFALIQQPLLYANKQAAPIAQNKFRNLILIMDPLHDERSFEDEGGGYLANILAAAIASKAAPVLMSGSLLSQYLSYANATPDVAKAIITIYQKYPFDNQIKQRRDAVNKLKSNYRALVGEYFPKGSDAYPLIGFDANEWLLYLHDQADLVLLVPKLYLRTYFTAGKDEEQLKAAGFNVGQGSHLSILNAPTLEILVNELTKQNAKNGNVVSAIKTCLLGDKNSDTELYTWNIYVTGHGGPARTKDQIQQYLQGVEYYKNGVEQELKSAQESHEKNPDSATQKKLEAYSSEINALGRRADRYRQIVARTETIEGTGILSTGAQIAGIAYNDFIDLIKFFETKGTSFVHYATCFGGGYNQAFVKNSLEKIDVNFLISSEGLGDLEISKNYIRIQFDPQTYQYSLRFTCNFGLFFERLMTFLGTPQKFAAAQKESRARARITYNAPIQDLVKDPIGWILSTVCDYFDLSALTNQTYIRIPRVGIFSPVNYFNDVQLLTKSMVIAASLENKPITISYKRALELFVSKVSVPLIFKNDDCAIVALAREIKNSTQQGNIEAESLVTTLFKEVKIEASLKDFIINLFKLNGRDEFFFIIDKLTCWSGGLIAGKSNYIDLYQCFFGGTVEKNRVSFSGMFITHSDSTEELYQFSGELEGTMADLLEKQGALSPSPATALASYKETFAAALKNAGGFFGDVPPEQFGSLGTILKNQENRSKEVSALKKKTAQALATEIKEIGKIVDKTAQTKQYKEIILRLHRLLDAGSIDEPEYNALLGTLPADKQKEAQLLRQK